LIRHGWISSEEGTSENNRRAKSTGLTTKGRRQLTIEPANGTNWLKQSREFSAPPNRRVIVSRRKRMIEELDQDIRDHIAIETPGQH